MAWIRLVERCKSEMNSDTHETQPISDTMLRSTSKTKSIKAKRDKRNALYLDRGRRHTVWTPKRPSKTSVGFTDVVMEVVKNRQSLLERQRRLRNRVMATQHVLKVQREVITNEDEEESGKIQQSTGNKQKKWKKVITKVMEENAKMKRNPSKTSIRFHDIVSQYVEATSKCDNDNAQSTATQAKAAARKSLRHWKSQFMEAPKTQKRMKKTSTESSLPIHSIVHHEPFDIPPISEENEM